MKKTILLLVCVFFAQTTFSQGLSFDKWEKVELQDEFGDKTGDFITRTFARGIFSNSATTNAKLIAKIIHQDDWVSISLYEYERTPEAKLVYEPSYGNILVKFENGDSKMFEVLAFKGGGIGAKAGTDFYDLITNGNSQKIKCLIKESNFTDYGNSSYLFEFITK